MTNQLKVAQPFTLPNGTVIKNRFFKSAMSEGLSKRNNAPNRLHIELYKQFALGGSGIVVTGNVMVDRKALGEPGNVVIDDASNIAPFKQWTNEGTLNQCELWIQLNHPGKQSPRFLSKQPVAPSAIPLKGSFKKFFKTPRALSNNEIKQLVRKFGQSAKSAKEVGFTGVQIHAAHGYLVSQFLSPYDNQRTDEYGGSLENRMRFLIEIYEQIRQEVGSDFSIGMKINSNDFKDKGFSEDDSLEVVQKMAVLGIDLIEISGGTYENPKMSTGTKGENELFFYDFAKKLKSMVEVPIVLTGGFRSLEIMEKALKENVTSMIGIARPLALCPGIPNQVFEGTYQTVITERLTTGLRGLDRRFGAIIGNSYYEQQMKRIAKGKKVKIHKNGWKPLFKTFIDHGPIAMIKRQ